MHAEVREDQIRNSFISRNLVLLLRGSNVDPITKCTQDTEGEGEEKTEGAGECVLILCP